MGQTPSRGPLGETHPRAAKINGCWFMGPLGEPHMGPHYNPPPRLRAWRVRVFSLPLAFCLWLWCLVFFFDFGVLGGPGFPASPSALNPFPPPRTLPGPPKTNIFCPRTTKNQYFLSPEHQKLIFSVPGPPKPNIF